MVELVEVGVDSSWPMCIHCVMSVHPMTAGETGCAMCDKVNCESTTSYLSLLLAPSTIREGNLYPLSASYPVFASWPVLDPRE